MNEPESYAKRRKVLLRHIDNVRKNCQVLGERLIEKGELKLGHRLIANGQLHDNSKFHGVEWEYLHGDVKENNPKAFEGATYQHIHTNGHHPEYWEGGIHKMPRVYLAELVCDWAARSAEFGNDLREWIKTKATKKFDMTVQSTVYKEIKGLVDLLLDEAFK